jgi:hypothetical protein
MPIIRLRDAFFTLIPTAKVSAWNQESKGEAETHQRRNGVAASWGCAKSFMCTPYSTSLAALITGHHLAVRPFAKRFGRELFLWRRLQATNFRAARPAGSFGASTCAALSPADPLRPRSKAIPRTRWNSWGSICLILHAFVVHT